MHSALRILTRRFRRLAADERGQALVEFAMVLPFLVLAIVTVLEFGKAFHHWQDESQLAGRGARLAAVNGLPTGCTGSLQNCVQQESDTPELKNGGTDSVANRAKVCITFPGGTAGGEPGEGTPAPAPQRLPILRRVGHSPPR